MSVRKVALVLGGTGTVGAHLVGLLEKRNDWDVIAVARRAPEFPTRARIINLDLSDARACAEGLSGIEDVTHAIYAAEDTDGDAPADRAGRNETMFENALSTLEAAAPNLSRMTLMQGSSVYGSHLGPYKTPAKETDARHMPPNHFFAQEDRLCRRQAGKPWSWTLLRPHAVSGFAPGRRRNAALAIAVYATLSKALALPLRFPGHPAAFAAISEATDATLLSQAALWSGTEGACANQAFNITNGDVFRWQRLWPLIAEYFQMEVGEVRTIALARHMADKGPLWDSLIERHGLERRPLDDLVDWSFADTLFAQSWDVMSDTTKCRTFGFEGFVDTEAMFIRRFDELRKRRIIP
ncbi:MAG: SDR family oxidoreductase [Rhodospirillales bacterium]|nr:SDR family oxidoreductase [Rhodospirillales bacterium]